MIEKILLFLHPLQHLKCQNTKIHYQLLWANKEKIQSGSLIKLWNNIWVHPYTFFHDNDKNCLLTYDYLHWYTYITKYNRLNMGFYVLLESYRSHIATKRKARVCFLVHSKILITMTTSNLTNQDSTSQNIPTSCFHSNQ